MPKQRIKLAAGAVVLLLIIGAVVFALNKRSSTENTADSSEKPSSPGVVASVNGVTITQDQLDNRLLTWKAAPVLDEMIDDELFGQLARKAGVTVSDEEVEDRLNFLKKDVVASLPFEQLMRLKGFTMKHIRDQIRRRIMIEKTIKQSIVVTDDQLKKVRASHILIPIQQVKNGDTKLQTKYEEQARAKAEQVLKEARKPGADFAALARKYSSDSTSKNKGGDIGIFRKSVGASPLTQTAFTLKPGEIGIAPTAYGFHIVKVTNIQLAEDMSKEEAEKERESIREEQMAMTIDQWTEKTKVAADIERYSYK